MVFIMSPLLPVLFWLRFSAGTIFSMSRQQRRNERIRPASQRSGFQIISCAFGGNDFFSTAERSFYEILRRIAPNHTIFAKVRLADLVLIRTNDPERRPE